MTANKSIVLDPKVIKIMRKKEKHTQDSLALEVEVSTRQIKRIENGEKTSISTALALGKAFGLELNQLQGKERIHKHMPYYWYQESFQSDGQWRECSGNKIGRIFDLDGFLFAQICDRIDNFDSNPALSPCYQKMNAVLTEDKTKNRFFLNVRVSYPRVRYASEREFKFEIRPFRFNESGMAWSAYCPLEADWFKFSLELCLKRTVTNFTSGDYPEVDDPSYRIDLFPQGLGSMTKDYLLAKKAKYGFHANNLNWLHDRAQIANAFSECENAASPEEEYENPKEYERFLQQFTACRPIGPYYFDTIEQVEKFVHKVIQKYQPEAIERHSQYYSAIKLKPKVSSTADCREVVINITRESKEQNKTLPWRKIHQDPFLDSFSDYANSLKSDISSSNLSLQDLNKIIASMRCHYENYE